MANIQLNTVHGIFLNYQTMTFSNWHTRSHTRISNDSGKGTYQQYWGNHASAQRKTHFARVSEKQHVSTKRSILDTASMSIERCGAVLSRSQYEVSSLSVKWPDQKTHLLATKLPSSLSIWWCQYCCSHPTHWCSWHWRYTPHRHHEGHVLLSGKSTKTSWLSREFTQKREKDIFADKQHECIHIKRDELPDIKRRLERSLWLCDCVGQKTRVL